MPVVISLNTELDKLTELATKDLGNSRVVHLPSLVNGDAAVKSVTLDEIGIEYFHSINLAIVNLWLMRRRVSTTSSFLSVRDENFYGFILSFITLNMLAGLSVHISGEFI